MACRVFGLLSIRHIFAITFTPMFCYDIFTVLTKLNLRILKIMCCFFAG